MEGLRRARNEPVRVFGVRGSPVRTPNRGGGCPCFFCFKKGGGDPRGRGCLWVEAGQNKFCPCVEQVAGGNSLSILFGGRPGTLGGHWKAIGLHQLAHLVLGADNGPGAPEAFFEGEWIPG